MNIPFSSAESSLERAPDNRDLIARRLNVINAGLLRIRASLKNSHGLVMDLNGKLTTVTEIKNRETQPVPISAVVSVSETQHTTDGVPVVFNTDPIPANAEQSRGSVEEYDGLVALASEQRDKITSIFAGKHE